MTTPPILCLTPNVALDRTLLVPDFEPGDVLRCKETIAAAGGKGLNVARALKIIGGQPYAMGLLGGHLGRLVADLTQGEGIDARWTWFDGETRICTILVPETQASTALNENGLVTVDDWNRFVDDVIASAEQADQVRHTDQPSVVAVSGSLPRGVPPSAPADLIERLCALDRPVWVDVSGTPLRNALNVTPTGVKVNGAEIGEVLGRRVDTPQDALEAAQAVRGRGIQWAVITLGADGAVLAGPDGSFYARAPRIDVVSAVGSGDSFFAGLLNSLVAGHPASAALASAVAAGSANAKFPGGARFPRAAYDDLLARVTVESL